MKTIYIGKGTDNDYVANDSTVSRKHASITVTDDGRIVLKDLNSTNGTFVNGKRIQSEVVLQPNDVVLLGRYNLDWKSVASSSNGGHTRRVAAYNPNKKVIGRANTCDVCLPYEDVSSEHAFLEKLSSGEIAITDNRSTNGTYVNGERITYTWKEAQALGYVQTSAQTDGTVTTITNTLWQMVPPPDNIKPGPRPGVPEDEIDDYGTPLGLGIIINHVGDCFD